MHTEQQQAAAVPMEPEPRKVCVDMPQGALMRSYCSIGSWGEMERADPPWVCVATSYALHHPPARRRHGWRKYPLDLFASVIAASQFLLHFDVGLAVALTVASTCSYWYCSLDSAVSMSWTAISFAIIFPITQGIALSFKRREAALRELGTLLGNVTAIWAAALTWKVPARNPSSSDGRPKFVPVFENYEDPESKRQHLRAVFDALLVALIAYCDAERWGRARNSIRCTGGDQEQRELQAIANRSRLQFGLLLGRVRMMAQDLKTVGLAGGEVHRLDSYTTIAASAFERLCSIKEYRTPQAFRAFTRVYILLVGSLYGPYFVSLGLGRTGSARNLWLSLLFACAAQLFFSGLFRVMLDLEDLFATRQSGHDMPIDVVKVPELVELTRQKLVQLEREAAADSWDAPFVQPNGGLAEWRYTMLATPTG